MARSSGSSPNVVALAVTVMCLVSSAVASGTWFDRLYVVVFENTDYSAAIADPNFKKWAQKGKLLTNYHAVSHPSQPNYIATIAGSTLGITDDNVHNLPNKNLVDLLEAKPISWKSYNEDYTGVCNLAATIGSAVCPNQSVKTSKTTLYARKHNPFISMIDVQNTTSRCAKIVSGAQLTTDKTNNAIPDFSYYVPNQCNDGHDIGVTYAGKFLDTWMTSTFTGNAISGRTLVVIIFDENSGTSGNQVYAALVPFGTMNVVVNSTDNTNFNHYSLLKTIEQNWSLGNLGTNDVTAVPFNFPRLACIGHMNAAARNT